MVDKVSLFGQWMYFRFLNVATFFAFIASFVLCIFLIIYYTRDLDDWIKWTLRILLPIPLAIILMAVIEYLSSLFV